jgi:hypothetical protein
MRTVRHLVPVLLAAAASLTGCTPDEQHADFEKATAAQREAVIPAGLDLQGEKAAILVTLAELDAQAQAEGVVACPARSIADSGAVVYEAKACTGAITGLAWDGRIEAKNSPRAALLGATIDAKKPEELRFIALTAGKLKVDGELVTTPVDGVLKGQRVIHNALTLDDGVAVSFDVDLDCHVEGAALACHTKDGSSGSIADLGRFDVRAVQSITDGNVSGSLELSGENVLRLDAGVRDADECIAYTIGEQAGGKVCLPELTSADPTSLAGIGWECTGADAISFQGAAKGAPIFGKVELRRAGVQEEIALDFVEYDKVNDVYHWAAEDVALADAGAFTCADVNATVGVRMVAIYANGTVECSAVGGDFNAFAGQPCL